MADMILQALRGVSSKPNKFITLLGEARKRTSERQITSLIDHARRVRALPPNGLIPSHERRDGLSRLHVLPRITLENEVLWACHQLAKIKPKLFSHLTLLNELTASCQEGDLSSALKIVDEHRRRHGASLWQLEAEIGCKSQMGRSDEVSARLKELDVNSPRTIGIYFAYKFADLYDPETTLGGFRRRLELDEKEMANESVRNYVHSKLTGDPRSLTELTDHLRMESSISYIDAYEALICVLFHAAQLSERQALKRTLIHAKTLLDLKDVRLITLFSAVGLTEAIVETPDKLCLDPNNFPCPEKIISLMKELIASRTDEPNFPNYLVKPEEKLAQCLAPVMQQRTDIGSCYRQLQTVAAKNNFLPWSHALSVWANAIFFPVAANYSYTFQLIACNYRGLGPAQQSPWIAIYGDNTEARRILALKTDGLSKENKEVVENNLHQIDGCQATPRYGLNMASIAASLYLKLDNEALEKSVRVAIDNPSISVFLPFEHLLDENMHWTELAEYDRINLLIGLHFSSLGERESKRKFHLEFACKDILTSNRCNSLVGLLDVLDPTDARVLFILREILIPKNLRLVGFLRTVEDLEKARLDLCAALLNYDKDNAELLLSEMREIFKAQEMRSAEMHLETARVYADKEGIKRWAEECFRDEFQQVRKNRASRSVLQLSEIGDLFGETSVRQLANEQLTGIKERPKDPLVSVGSTIFTRCFWKEDDGLDHFLSLRIRHGSLAGYLRAPLERAHLFGPNAGSSAEATSEYWQSRLLRTLPSVVNQLSEILYSFQVRFDKMIEHLRSERIQIYSESKPLGLIQPGIPFYIWDTIKADWENATSFDAFFESVWKSFELALDMSLSEVQDFMDSYVLHETECMLDQLRDSVSQLRLPDADHAQVISSFNEATTGLQEAIRTVKGWFSFRDSTSTETSLTTEQLIALGLKLFKKARPTFDLRLQTALFGNARFSATYISRITDALFILFDNVFQHSGFDDGADVSLSCEWEYDSFCKGRIKISVESPVSTSVDISDAAMRIEAVKTKICNHEQSALVTEGGSGLIKLARIADASGPLGKLDFWLSADNRFCVEIWIEAEFMPISRGT